MFANDMFREGKPNADRESWGRIAIGDNVSIGSGATILSVSICDGVVIGAGSVVTRSISEKGVYAGNPRGYCGGYKRSPDKWLIRATKALAEVLALIAGHVIQLELAPQHLPPSRVSGVQPTAARLRVGPEVKRSIGMFTYTPLVNSPRRTRPLTRW